MVFAERMSAAAGVGGGAMLPRPLAPVWPQLDANRGRPAGAGFDEHAAFRVVGDCGVLPYRQSVLQCSITVKHDFDRQHPGLTNWNSVILAHSEFRSRGHRDAPFNNNPSTAQAAGSTEKSGRNRGANSPVRPAFEGTSNGMSKRCDEQGPQKEVLATGSTPA